MLLSRKIGYAFKYKSCKYITCVIFSVHTHNTYLIMVHLENYGVFKKLITIILNYFKPTLGQKESQMKSNFIEKA